MSKKQTKPITPRKDVHGSGGLYNAEGTVKTAGLSVEFRDRPAKLFPEGTTYRLVNRAGHSCIEVLAGSQVLLLAPFNVIHNINGPVYIFRDSSWK